mgnify:FL=1
MIKQKLPVLTLAEFSGSFSEWLAFKDTFKSVIHENTTLSNVEKMHYLRSALKVEALRAIDAIAVSSANYNAAWDILQKRYENERLLVHAHVKNILNAQGVPKPNAELLRSLCDNITNKINKNK